MCSSFFSTLRGAAGTVITAKTLTERFWHNCLDRFAALGHISRDTEAN